MSEQDQQIARVKDRIGAAVLRFCGSRLDLGCPEFRGAELTAYVRDAVLSAPASADRILRLLRREGRLDYRLLDRRGSLYRIVSVTEPEEAQP